MKNDNDLFFTCSLIEFIGRQQKLKRSDVVTYLGEEKVKRIYNYADVFHCDQLRRLQMILLISVGFRQESLTMLQNASMLSLIIGR